jgi:hypothetical protein
MKLRCGLLASKFSSTALISFRFHRYILGLSKCFQDRLSRDVYWGFKAYQRSTCCDKQACFVHQNFVLVVDSIDCLARDLKRSFISGLALDLPGHAISLMKLRFLLQMQIRVRSKQQVHMAAARNTLYNDTLAGCCAFQGVLENHLSIASMPRLSYNHLRNPTTKTTAWSITHHTSEEERAWPKTTHAVSAPPFSPPTFATLTTLTTLTTLASQPSQPSPPSAPSLLGSISPPSSPPPSLSSLP